MLLRLLSQDVAHQVRFAAVIHLGELLRDDLGNDAFFFHSVLPHPVTHSSTPLLPYTVIAYRFRSLLVVLMVWSK